jgi:hypothetical protein
LHAGTRERRAAVGAIPPDQRRALCRQPIDEVAAGETRCAGDEDQCGTPLMAPLNGEKLPSPANVNDRKNRWSDG